VAPRGPTGLSRDFVPAPWRDHLGQPPNPSRSCGGPSRRCESSSYRSGWEYQRRRHGRIENYLNRRLQLTTHFIDFDVESWDDRTNLDDVVEWVSRTLEDLRANRRAFRPAPSACRKKRTFTDRPSLTSTSGRHLTITRRRLATGLLPVARRSAAGSTLRCASAERSIARRRSTTSAASRSRSSSACQTGCATYILDALAGQAAVVVATGESTRQKNGVYGLRASPGSGPRWPGLSAVFALQDWFPGGP